MISKVCNVLIVVGLFLTGTANATSVWYDGPIKMVYPMGDGSFVVGVVATFSCSSAGSTRYLYVTPGQNGVSADGAKNMLATVLSAFALDQSVQIVFDDSTQSCFVNRLLMYR